MADPPDADLRSALLRLLATDSYPRTGRMLCADTRLLSPEAATLVGGLATEAETGGLPVTAALVRQYRAFLGRCAPNTLDAVFPAGSTMNDPQVVTVLQDDLDCARAADADYARAGRDDDVDHADRAWQRILAVPAVGDAYPDLRAALLNDAAASALRRFWHRGEAADLRRAEQLYRHALDLTPRVSARRVSRLGNLAMVRREAHLRSGGDDAIEEAETLLREAVSLVDRSRGQLTGVEVLANLALVLRDRYLAVGDPTFLHDAVAIAERACAASDVPGPRIVLGDLLSQRYVAGGDADDLNHAYALLHDALGRLPEDAPERPRAMVDLAVALGERYGVTGDPADLDNAVELIESARALLPATAPDRPSADAQLAVMLYRRFEASGRLDDLDRAVELLATVIVIAPDAEVARPTWQANLAATLIQRSLRTGSPADLDRAVDIYLRLAAADETRTDRYAVLNNLGNALRDRSRRSPSTTDLDRAVVFLREALNQCADGSARRASTLSNLGVALHDRFVLTGRTSDLDEARDLTRQASAMRGGADADRARRLFARALVAQTAANHGDATGRDEAVAAYREGCRIGLAADAESTLIAAQAWGRWAGFRGDWTSAAEAYPYAVRAVEMLVGTQVVRDHQEVWLRSAPALPARAAFAAVAIDRPVDAVVALERTRAALLSETLRRSRVDLALLGHGRPDLRDRYERAAGLVQRQRAAEVGPR